MPRKTERGSVAAAAMPFSRVCGIAALGFAALIVLANVIAVPAGLPHSGATPADVTAFFGTRGDIIGVSSALTPAAWVLATLFGAGAVAAVRRSESDRGEAWSLLGFAGLVMQNSAFAAIIALRLALTSTAPDDGATTAGLWALHDALFTLNGTFLAIALVGLSTGGRRSGLITTWHFALGLLSATLMFTSATLTPLVTEHGGPFGLLGLTGWLLWVAWITAYGIALIRRPGHRRPSTAVRAALGRV
ncbi:hypothetical protein ACFOVU_17015 [Nocardiopsis sediminis]|uniref:DUF4386 family protein n=1 Tax=Nocardiopsis sediminis TaxID=1778267 RepID=A0ABV8FP52_9ACTN